MQAQIKHLRQQGLSIRQVARALGISRQTVRKFAMQEPEADVTTQEVKAAPMPGWDAAIDWEKVAQQARQKGITAKQLHRENAPEVSYWRFWRRLRQHVPQEVEISLRRSHERAQRVEVDYTDGIGIVDRMTGEVRKTHLFCGVLPFSAYTFGEFVWDQKLPSFIASHERMWHFLGGVTPYVVCDNLKAGVHKAHRYDPDINPTYCDFANHWGFAVVPARPYKPRDKAAIEAVIGVIQRDFYMEVRNRAYYALAELNADFGAYLKRLNGQVMKDYGVSRAQRFAAEQPLLKPLPAARFELHEWRRAKVHPDCHIQVRRNFYSVPFRAVGPTVRVRLSDKLVEIFDLDLQQRGPLAVHTRLEGTGKFATDERHYPDKKLGIKRFEVRTAQSAAQAIGPNTTALVEALVAADYPLRHLRRIQGILRLAQSGHVGHEALEYACHMALSFNKPRFAYVKACAEHYQANGPTPTLAGPRRQPGTLFLHGQSVTQQDGGAP